MLLLLILLIFTVSPQNQTQLILNQPSILMWQNQQQQLNQSLLIYNISIQNKIVAEESLILPESYTIDYSTGVYNPSLGESKIYQYRSIEKNVRISYLHLRDNRIVSRGDLSSNGQEISTLFTIESSDFIQETYHSSCAYLLLAQSTQFHDIYQIQSTIYSKTPGCFLVSPMTQQFWSQTACQTMSPLSVIQQQLFIKSYQYYTVHRKIAEIFLSHEEKTFNLFMKDPTLEKYIVYPLEISEELDIELEAEWEADTRELVLNFRNKKDRFEYVEVRCMPGQVDYCEYGLMLDPLEIKQIVILIPKHLETVDVQVSGIKTKNPFLLKVDSVTQKIEIIQSGENQAQDISTVDQDNILGLIIGGAAGGSAVLCCIIFFFCFIIRRKKKKQGEKNLAESQQSILKHSKISSLTTLQTLQRQMKQMHMKNNPEQNQPNIDMIPKVAANTVSEISLQCSPRFDQK